MNFQSIRDRRSLNCVVIFVGAFLLQLGRLNQFGRFNSEMTYDDVGYAAEGHHFYEIFIRGGFFELIVFFVNNPPHAPISSLMAFFIFLFSTPSNFAIYAFNAFCVGILLFGIVAKMKIVSTEVSFIVASFLWLSPLGFFLSSNFRPDILFALLVGFFVYISNSLSVKNYSENPNIHWWLVGAISLMLYVKPSFIFYTFTMVLGQSFLFIFREKWFGGSFVSTFKTISRVALFTFVMLIPFFLLFLNQTVQYVIDNTIGVNSEVWTIPHFEAFRWNLITITQIIGLPWLMIMLCIYIYSTLKKDNWGFISPQNTAIWYLFSIVFSLIPLYASGTKSAYFSLTPFVIFIVGGLQIVGQSASVITTYFHTIWRNVIICIFILMFILSSTAFPKFAISNNLKQPKSINEKITGNVLEDCQSNSLCVSEFLARGHFPSIYVAVMGDEVSPDTISWKIVTQGWVPNVKRIEINGSFASAVTKIAESQYVVLAVNNIPGVNWRIPVNSYQDELANVLRNTVVWKRLEIPEIDTNYQVFKRR